MLATLLLVLASAADSAADSDLGAVHAADSHNTSSTSASASSASHPQLDLPAPSATFHPALDHVLDSLSRVLHVDAVIHDSSHQRLALLVSLACLALAVLWQLYRVAVSRSSGGSAPTVLLAGPVSSGKTLLYYELVSSGSGGGGGRGGSGTSGGSSTSTTNASSSSTSGSTSSHSRRATHTSMQENVAIISTSSASKASVANGTTSSSHTSRTTSSSSTGRQVRLVDVPGHLSQQHKVAQYAGQARGIILMVRVGSGGSGSSSGSGGDSAADTSVSSRRW